MKKNIFVFGSNLHGIHGGGAAKFARDKCGAIWGVGVGMQGDSYGIPTKYTPAQTMQLDEIKLYVNQFINHAARWDRVNIDSNSPNCPSYLLTRIGCGLAGLKDEDIGPMFHSVGTNVIVPVQWRQWLHVNGRKYHDEGKLVK